MKRGECLLFSETEVFLRKDQYREKEGKHRRN